jgi:hypothetical protein
LNQCVFQWFALKWEQGLVGSVAALFEEEWAQGISWEDASRGCDEQLNRSDEIIASPDFANKVDKLIQDAKKKLAPESVISQPILYFMFDC